MDDAIIRTAGPDDLSDVAELRWQWTLENGGTPPADHDGFVRDFVQWAGANASTHQCVIAACGDAVIGMAWLAVLARVPTPAHLVRVTGDVQSVYVVPGERGAGLGSRMIDTLLDRAMELGLARVTVHSSTRAITTYQRRGFKYAKQLLQVEIGQLQRRREMNGASTPDPR